MNIADLTMQDLELLIRRIVDDAISEALDEDGLELREDFVAEMRGRMANPGPHLPVEEVRRTLGLER